jgi:hypothetical protein
VLKKVANQLSNDLTIDRLKQLIGGERRVRESGRSSFLRLNSLEHIHTDSGPDLVKNPIGVQRLNYQLF